MNKGIKTVVIGASTNPSRFSHKAVLKLKKFDYEVIAIGNRKGAINDVEITTEVFPYENIHTVTLYLNPQNQKSYYDYILSLKPRRIIFNPGTENQELSNLAKSRGIEVVENCTLVMLSMGLY